MNVLTYVTYIRTYVERSIGMGHPVYWHTLEPIVPVKVASSLALLERKRIAWRRFYLPHRSYVIHSRRASFSKKEVVLAIPAHLFIVFSLHPFEINAYTRLLSISDNFSFAPSTPNPNPYPPFFTRHLHCPSPPLSPSPPPPPPIRYHPKMYYILHRKSSSLYTYVCTYKMAENFLNGSKLPG